MIGLVSAGELLFEGGPLPVFVGSDRRVYARFLDLCALLGLDWRRCLLRAEETPGLAGHLIACRGIEVQGYGYALFMNLSALPMWLGSLRPQRMRNAEVRERVTLLARQVMDVPWMLIREGSR